MKKFVLSFGLACVLLTGTCVCAFAQDVQMATLQQGDDLQVFYGQDALRNAMAAADNGDIITLSAGTFNGTNLVINKAVVLQGAGYVNDVENGRYRTAISSNTINIELQESDGGLVIEGIFFNGAVYNRGTLVSCTFRKCRFSDLNLRYTANGYTGSTKQCLIDQCRISSNLIPDIESENLYVKNSIINIIQPNSPLATLFVENCIILNYIYTTYSTSSGSNNGTTAVLKNSIIGGVLSSSWDPNYGSSSSYNNSLQRDCSAYNNVFIRGNVNSLVNVFGNMTSDANALFGNTNMAYDDNRAYELTPEAQTAFLGGDGKQVGIYGGDTPFTDVPTNPQITEREIDTKSSPDGKLKVNITVEAQN